MTQPKTLSPAEALRALAAGTKLIETDAPPPQYVHLADDGTLRYHDGRYYNYGFANFIEYTEPRPRRKEIWVEYLASPTCSQVQSAGIYYFREGHIPEHTLWRYTETGRSLEVTIED